MKTILHIHQNFYPYNGGSTMRLLNLIRSDQNNKQIVISRMWKGYSRKDTYENIVIYRYKMSCEIPFIIKKICQSEKVDIIHCHNLRPAFWGKITNIFLKRPIILEMHSVYEVKGFLKKKLRKAILFSAKYIIVLSDESKKILVREGIPNNHIYVLYNGIYLNKFSDFKYRIAELSINNFFEQNKNKVIAGYIGSLSSFQGIDNLINIFNCINNEKVSFILIGGEKNEIKDLRGKITNENVFLHEFISQEEVASVYSKLDILLMPRPINKQTNSAVPLKPIEALVSGCKILATASGGMLELKKITDNNNLIICDINQMIDILNNQFIKKTNKAVIQMEGLYQFDIERQRDILFKIYEMVYERCIRE